MEIKYLKGDWNARAGDVKDVESAAANVLIRLGKAEKYTKPQKKKQTYKTKDMKAEQ